MGRSDSGQSRLDQLGFSLRDDVNTGGISSADRESLIALHEALADRGDFTYLTVPSDRMSAPELSADLCFIDPSHANGSALQDARFCRRVIRDRGVIVFHDRTIVGHDIRRFLRELARYRAYPLAHDLLVVEINAPTLLSDPRVRARVPRPAWLIADRLRATRVVLWLDAMLWLLRQMPRWAALILVGPRRRRLPASRPAAAPDLFVGPPFEIYTFANNAALYDRMCESFVGAGFSPSAFVPLSDSHDNPYAAITRIGEQSAARYPILCHQDVLADQGAGAPQLLAALEQLDAIDPRWVVAGTAGVMRSGRQLRRVIDPHGGSTGEILPLPVVTLDGFFLVFNGRNAARCSTDISEYHLYGGDVCLHALSSGGSAYVIDFPLTHATRNAGRPATPAAERATSRFIEEWSKRCWFRYVPTTIGTFFVSRSKLLRRFFGSPYATALIDTYSDVHWGSQLRLIDHISASPHFVGRR
jgi:hypothetical protein